MKNTLLVVWEERFIAYFNRSAELGDGSHDLGHFQRVWRTASAINQSEGEPADQLILLTAAYFHDVINLPKNHPDRRNASRLSAERAAALLVTEWDDYPREKIDGVRHAIHAHSYSAGIEPVTFEAKILQDADRMEALGAIGLARVFYTAGHLHSAMFDPADPFAERRDQDDRKYALDHFQMKLLRLPSLMNTASGRRMAGERAGYLQEFLARIGKEIEGGETGLTG